MASAAGGCCGSEGPNFSGQPMLVVGRPPLPSCLLASVVPARTVYLNILCDRIARRAVITGSHAHPHACALFSSAGQPSLRQPCGAISKKQTRYALLCSALLCSALLCIIPAARGSGSGLTWAGRAMAAGSCSVLVGWRPKRTQSSP